ncbi:MAG TPA: phytase, partial [Planctomycetota bacterium]|nr:phytase [Planctomycetota bacterium]
MSRKFLCVVGALCALAGGLSAQLVGPSTSSPCYVVPSAGLPPGAVETVALLTVGDSIGGYRLVGIPDGMGGFFAPDGAATVLVNHELSGNAGIVRPHGSKGAFVSRWTIDPVTKAVVSGRDHNTSSSTVHPYDRTTNVWTTGTFQWERFCSADLAPPTAFFHYGLGTTARIFLNGEETGPNPRDGYAWAHVVSGPGFNHSWELPHMGQCAFENVVASPFPQNKTIVALCDDSDAQTNPALTNSPSELYFY